MVFNSFIFAFYLPIVFLLYWIVFSRTIKLRNCFLVVISYFFYGWWDWRFLFLLAFSSLVDYYIGKKIFFEGRNPYRKGFLAISLIINLGLLGIFKYYNFFVESFILAFSSLGVNLKPTTLNIILPVGISFYTFQTLSYTIDIYRRKLEPAKDGISFLAFVSFFPQLVAGPIERASALLPQFYTPKNFDVSNAKDGLRQMLLGFFKKMVVADNCAVVADQIFSSPESFSSHLLWFGAICFAIQIYGDFSGYSDIAIGVSRLFGFELMQNFSFPYFSRDIAEFWRRWHISLSTWFRDYLYVPLGGSRVSKSKAIRNTFLIFLVSGFWHGANWTFIIWGFLNALYFLPLLLTDRNRSNLGIIAQDSAFPRLSEIFGMVFTFILTTIAWVFFRAKDLNSAIEYIKGMFRFTIAAKTDLVWFDNKYVIGVILFMFFLEWTGRRFPHALMVLADKHFLLRWSVYYVLTVLILFMQNSQSAFIYFQF